MGLRRIVVLGLAALLFLSACLLRQPVASLQVAVERPPELDGSKVVLIQVQSGKKDYSKEVVFEDDTAFAAFELPAGKWQVYVTIQDEAGAPTGWTGTAAVVVQPGDETRITVSLEYEAVQSPLFRTSFETGLPQGWIVVSNMEVAVDGDGNPVLRSTNLDGDSRSGPDLMVQDFLLTFRLKVQQFRGQVSRFQVDLARSGANEWQIWFSGNKVSVGTASGPGLELSVVDERSYTMPIGTWVDVEIRVEQQVLTVSTGGELLLSATIDAATWQPYFWSWTTLYAIDDVEIWEL